MAYPHYMNMGFGGHDPSSAYMMSGMQIPSRPVPPVSNHVPQELVSRPNQAPSGGGGNKSGGKRKMSTDPNRPKRPTSAYFFFIQLEREAAARRGEKITRVAEWTKQVSAKWRELTVTEKIPYNKMAATDKIRYTQQKAIYTGKDANRPKRPSSAYILWLADFRARMKSKFAENKDLLRAAGEEWRKLTSMDKMPYDQMAEREKQKYGDAMKDYNMGCSSKKQKLDVDNRSAAAASNGTTTSSSYHAPPPPLPPPPPQQQQQQLQQQPLQKSVDYSKPPLEQQAAMAPPDNDNSDDDDGDTDGDSEEDDEYE